MEKRRKVSIAWFLFFGALSCLMPSQWKTVTAILAGVALAYWLTSRFKVKLLYVAWVIFPLLCLIFMDSIGNKAVGWCEENSPSVVANKAVHYFKEISDGKPSEAIRNVVDKSPEARQELIDSATSKIKAGFSKLILTAKDFAKYLSKRLYAEPAPTG